MLVDSHCHLNFPQFSEDVGAVIARAKENGVSIMQTICTKMSEFPEVLAIAEKYPEIWASVGIHPHEADKENVTVDELVQASLHSKVIGIGETGLDYFYEHSAREAQQERFRTHIAAARKTGLPVIVHSRDADEDTIEILRDEMEKGSFKFLIHCFSSSLYLAEESIKIGGYISISGIITFKKSTALQEAVSQLPLSRLLVETDAPYLAPTPHRGKTNEPAYTKFTATYLADLLGIEFDIVARTTTENFFTLFDKAKK